ncbi:Uncharacterised protein [Acinetobacter baumannii]|nr:Uncharacterised protein [Acinetobacter baumannii]
MNMQLRLQQLVINIFMDYCLNYYYHLLEVEVFIILKWHSLKMWYKPKNN